MPDKHEVDAAKSSSPIFIACKYKQHEGKAKREDNMERVESFVVLEMGTKGW
jgi:hypothetical protein